MDLTRRDERIRIMAWAKRIGIRKAQNRLLEEGLSFSLAYQITAGNYRHKASSRTTAILERAMK